jgi:hypothetical protein
MSQMSGNEVGVALIGASQDGNILDMCRLINQGADVDYIRKIMHEGKERGMTPLRQLSWAM